MPKISTITCLVNFLAFFVVGLSPTRAQAPGGLQIDAGKQSGRSAVDSADPVEKFLKSAPASSLRKLKNPATAGVGAAELNKYFGKTAINKWVVVRTKAEVVEPTPDGRNAARIRAASLPVEWNGGSMERLSWLYFPAENALAADGVKVGEEIAVYGQVRKCEIEVTQGGVRLDFDLWKAKVQKP